MEASPQAGEDPLAADPQHLHATSIAATPLTAGGGATAHGTPSASSPGHITRKRPASLAPAEVMYAPAAGLSTAATAAATLTACDSARGDTEYDADEGESPILRKAKIPRITGGASTAAESISSAAAAGSSGSSRSRRRLGGDQAGAAAGGLVVDARAAAAAGHGNSAADGNHEEGSGAGEERPAKVARRRGGRVSRAGEQKGRRESPGGMSARMAADYGGRSGAGSESIHPASAATPLNGTADGGRDDGGSGSGSGSEATLERVERLAAAAQGNPHTLKRTDGGQSAEQVVGTTNLAATASAAAAPLGVAGGRQRRLAEVSSGGGGGGSTSRRSRARSTWDGGEIGVGSGVGAEGLSASTAGRGGVADTSSLSSRSGRGQRDRRLPGISEQESGGDSVGDFVGRGGDGGRPSRDASRGVDGRGVGGGEGGPAGTGARGEVRVGPVGLVGDQTDWWGERGRRLRL